LEKEITMNITAVDEARLKDVVKTAVLEVVGDYRVGLAVGKHEARATTFPLLLPLQCEWWG
jgi:hypothetical protein